MVLSADPRRPRLVATDLDGTLVREDGSVSAYTRDVLADLDARGVPVVIVTARPLRWMTDIWPLVGRVGVAIVSNGALVHDARSGLVHRVRGIAPADGLALAERIRAALPAAAFAIETPAGIALEPGFDEPHPVPADTAVGALAEVWREPAVKLLVRQQPPGDPVALRAAVVAAVGADAVPTWSGDGLVEISAPGVTKASALAELCATLEIRAADVIAFGDMPNDLPMLQWAGTACAVANADPAVLAVADLVAPANDDDGVARTLAEVYGLPRTPGL